MTTPLSPLVPRKAPGRGGAIREYDEATAATLLRRYSEGESLTAIIADLDIPGLSTVWEWKVRYPAFAMQYSRARELSAEALELAAIERAQAATGMTAQADRLYCDVARWAASKRLPRVYSDKAEVTMSVADTDGQVMIENAAKARRILMERLTALAIPSPLTIEGTSNAVAPPPPPPLPVRQPAASDVPREARERDSAG